MFKEKDRILVIGAHPDDEVLGCGGAIITANKLGSKVSLLCLGEGVSSRFKNFNSDKRLVAHQIRMKEFNLCLKKLNIKDSIIEDRLCNQFDTYSLLSIVKSIEKAINKFKPNIIFTHNKYEVNIDHRITYEATEVATRPVKNNYIEKIYSYEIPCSGNWTLNKKFLPNTYLDISSVWSKKMQAWKSFKNEIRPYPFPRSLESLKIISEFRGIQSGLKLAEAFKLERSVYK